MSMRRIEIDILIVIFVMQIYYTSIQWLVLKYMYVFELPVW